MFILTKDTESSSEFIFLGDQYEFVTRKNKNRFDLLWNDLYSEEVKKFSSEITDQNSSVFAFIVTSKGKIIPLSCHYDFYIYLHSESKETVLDVNFFNPKNKLL